MDSAVTGGEAWVLGKNGGPYLIYMKKRSEVAINLSKEIGAFRLKWINPIDGKTTISKKVVKSGHVITPIGLPPADHDWIGILSKK